MTQKIILKNLNYVQCLTYVLWFMASWFMTLMVYSPYENNKTQWNIPSWLIAPMEKVYFYEKLFFDVVICHGKR